MIKKTKTAIVEHPFISLIIAILAIYFITLIPFFYTLIADKATVEYTFVYYLLSTCITASLTIIAFIQFQKINFNLNAEYLLKINEMWRSSEIIKARIIIHELYLKAQEELKEKNIAEKVDIHRDVGGKIVDLSTSKQKEDFIYLLNFLDFMETIGYFYTNKYLEEKHLYELFGASLKFNYEIFEPYIKHRREKHKNPKFYCEFEKLYDFLFKNESNLNEYRRDDKIKSDVVK